MKKIGLSAMIASALAATVLGLASPANADLGHNLWVNQMNASSNSSTVNGR